MARPAKFYFEPVKIIKGKEPNEGNGSVSVNCSVGRMGFCKRAMQIFGGKIIKLFVDKSKKAIGWEVFEQGQLQDLRNSYLLKVFESKTGKYQRKIMSIGIRSTIKQLNNMSNTILEGTFNQLPIQEYRDNEMGKKFYYVILEK